jgi:hypothetical protein
VQQRGAERRRVEAHAGADLRDPDRVGDELVARVPQLVGMVIAGKIEGALERGPVDLKDRRRGISVAARDATVAVALGDRRGVELLDYGKEIGQECLVRYRCLCASRYCRASSWRAL